MCSLASLTFERVCRTKRRILHLPFLMSAWATLLALFHPHSIISWGMWETIPCPLFRLHALTSVTLTGFSHISIFNALYVYSEGKDNTHFRSLIITKTWTENEIPKAALLFIIRYNDAKTWDTPLWGCWDTPLWGCLVTSQSFKRWSGEKTQNFFI